MGHVSRVLRTRAGHEPNYIDDRIALLKPRGRLSASPNRQTLIITNKKHAAHNWERYRACIYLRKLLAGFFVGIARPRRSFPSLALKSYLSFDILYAFELHQIAPYCPDAM